jgi:hypothetical protein
MFLCLTSQQTQFHSHALQHLGPLTGCPGSSGASQPPQPVPQQQRQLEDFWAAGQHQAARQQVSTSTTCRLCTTVHDDTCMHSASRLNTTVSGAVKPTTQYAT